MRSIVESFEDSEQVVPTYILFGQYRELEFCAIKEKIFYATMAKLYPHRQQELPAGGFGYKLKFKNNPNER